MISSITSCKRRLTNVRNAPLRDEDRDLLQSVEPWIQKSSGYPDLTCLSGVFTSLDNESLTLLTVCGDYLSAIVALLNTKFDSECSASLRGDIDGAIWIYQAELHRTLSNRLRSESQFWHLFNKRQAPLRHNPEMATHAERYSMYCIPIDAAYFMNARRGQLAYEMLTQSFISLAKGFDQSQTHVLPSTACNTAIRLIQGFNLPCFTQWIQQLMFNQESLDNRRIS